MHKLLQHPVVRFFVWLLIAFVLTVLAMTVWLMASKGAQSTASLKWLQLLQTLGTFTLPPIVCAWLWTSDNKPFAWLKLDRGLSWQTALLAILIMVCAIPGINLLVDLNGRVELPEWLDSIEQILKKWEDSAATLTERFLQADSVGGLLINLGLMAVLPALSEELTFRGTIQQILQGGRTSNSTLVHIAVWTTAFIFSAIHMQFYGFVPRMLMGAMFGYAFVWTGCLWVPVLMHFTNNALAVITYYLFGEIGENGKSLADLVGTGSMEWLGVLSILVTLVLLGLLYKRTRE